MSLNSGSRMNRDRRDAAAEKVKPLSQRHEEAKQNPPPFEVRQQLREQTLAVGRKK